MLIRTVKDRSKTRRQIAQTPALERASITTPMRNMIRWQDGWRRPREKSHGVPVAVFREVTGVMSSLLRRCTRRGGVQDEAAQKVMQSKEDTEVQVELAW